MSRTGRLSITTMGLVALLASLVVLLAWQEDPASAQAAASGAEITVDTTADISKPNPDCSLREAIVAANTNKGFGSCPAGRSGARDTIDFSLGQRATLVLTKTLPTITDPSGLTIYGGKEAKITVSGNHKVRVLVVGKGAKLTLRNLTISNGSASNSSSDTTSSGAGVANRGGTLNVVSSTFSGNHAINYGGAVSNLSRAGVVNVTNSTFSGNTAAAGGGVLNDGKLRVSYSTFWNNDADYVGGGIQNSNARSATTTLSNTVLAKSDGGNFNNACAAGVCRGKITDGGYNISDDKTSPLRAQTSKKDVDPRLDPDGLQYNGGPTKTISLRTTSPAINFIPKGTNGCGTTTKTDQRGVQRPQGKKCDAGAYEKALQR